MQSLDQGLATFGEISGLEQASLLIEESGGSIGADIARVAASLGIDLIVLYRRDASGLRHPLAVMDE